MKLTAVLVLATAAQTLASPQLPTTPLTPAAPTVKLSYGTFSGKTGQGVNSFLGMPFALAPVGDRRFRRAQTPPANLVGIQGKYLRVLHTSS